MIASRGRGTLAPVVGGRAHQAASQNDKAHRVEERVALSRRAKRYAPGVLQKATHDAEMFFGHLDSSGRVQEHGQDAKRRERRSAGLLRQPRDLQTAKIDQRNERTRHPTNNGASLFPL